MKNPNEAAVSRQEFLRASAAASGIGLVLASAGQTAQAATAQERRGHVVTITHGPDDAARVMLALFTATRLPPGDNHVWFAIDGGQLCKKAEAEKLTSPLFEKQGTAAKLIEQIRAKGTAIHI